MGKDANSFDSPHTRVKPFPRADAAYGRQLKMMIVGNEVLKEIYKFFSDNFRQMLLKILDICHNILYIVQECRKNFDDCRKYRQCFC